MFETVAVIAFDLDDTLWPCMPTIHRAEKAVYDWLSDNYPRITEHHSEHSLFEYRREFMNRHDHYRIDLSLMRRDMFAELAREFDYAVEPLVEDSFSLFYRLRHDVDFYDDVFPVIHRLRGRYRLGSISNGNASAGLTELGRYFDNYINAADVMARKPDTRIFHAFCERMQAPPGQCLYVGDDPHYDIVGAREAGLQTVWVNRDATDWPKELPRAQAEVGDLYQLLDLLDEA